MKNKLARDSLFKSGRGLTGFMLDFLVESSYFWFKNKVENDGKNIP